MSLALSPFAAMSFSSGSAEISTAPLAGGAVYQAVQRAEDASDGKDAAFENLITKMAKVVDDLLKEKAVSSQRIIQLESQREEAERASQSKERALLDALKTQGKEIIALKQSHEAFKKQVASLEAAFKVHVHVKTLDTREPGYGYGPYLNMGTKPHNELDTTHTYIQIKWPGQRHTITVPDYRPIPTYCQTLDSEKKAS